MDDQRVDTDDTSEINYYVTREQQAEEEGKYDATMRRKFFSFSNITFRTVIKRSQRYADQSMDNHLTGILFVLMITPTKKRHTMELT